LENAAANLFNSTIHNCSAARGGAIYIQDNATVTLLNTTVTVNNATTAGGAVYLMSTGNSSNMQNDDGLPSFVLQDHSNCTNNTAPSGGCVYIANNGYVRGG